jgi:hypothetical protein
LVVPHLSPRKMLEIRCQKNDPDQPDLKHKDAERVQELLKNYSPESAAPISLATICSKHQALISRTIEKMYWGQVSIFFAVACFAAIVFLMIYRKPHA